MVLTANVKTLKFVKPQRVSIKVDGKEIGIWEIGSAWKWEKHGIVVEPDEHRPDTTSAVPQIQSKIINRQFKQFVSKRFFPVIFCFLTF